MTATLEQIHMELTELKKDLQEVKQGIDDIRDGELEVREEYLKKLSAIEKGKFHSREEFNRLLGEQSLDWQDEYSDDLTKILQKLKKKDPVQYIVVRKKMTEILKNPLHYKNLRYDVSDRRRVHVNSSFVLVYSIDIHKNLIRFLNYDHHDVIYNR